MDVNCFYKGKKRSDLEGGKLERAGCTLGPPVPTPTSATPERNATKILKAEKRLLEPESIWREFPRQQMAFDFATTCWQSVAVFAFESEDMGQKGQRRYLVTTYYEFGRCYLDEMKSPRHYYEVIVEGSACHLYFDIEFKRQNNPQVDALSTLETFIQYVCYQLYIQFSVDCTRAHVLDLDSSSPEKFSRHLVFHLPQAVFRNTTHTGNFVHHICDRLREFKHLLDIRVPEEHAFQQLFEDPKRGGPTKCPPVDKLLSLFVLNERAEKVLICDEAVYTRNRNFRLFLSSKLGKNVFLKVAMENKFKSSYCEGSRNRRRSQLFNTLMDSLVCNVKYNGRCTLLQFEDPRSRKVCMNQKRPSRQVSPGPSPLEGFNHSPYPLVDQFVTSQVTRGGVQGSIRRWTFFPQGKVVVYDIMDNRWCENIGRTHKSNNIMIIADLRRGVYYQKCYDPECRRIDFRSAEYEIPTWCNPVQPQVSKEQTGRREPRGVDGDFGSLTDEEFLERTAADVDLLQDDSVSEREAEYDMIFAEASKLQVDHVTSDVGHVTSDGSHVTLAGDHVTLDGGHVTLAGDHVTLADHVTLDGSHAIQENNHMTQEMTAELYTNTDQLDAIYEEAYSQYDTSMQLLQTNVCDILEETVIENKISYYQISEDSGVIGGDDFNMSVAELESFCTEEDEDSPLQL